tara:strand:+ start:409 stop:609 length:201 start_codon:yes stop_codon:yes gene_type:complete
MIPQEVYGVLFFFGGTITFLLFCWWLCHYADREKYHINRLCRRREEQYYRSERKHYKRRKDLGKTL